MLFTTESRPMLADLATVEGEAELIGEKIVQLLPTGHTPNQVAGEIFFRLNLHVRATGRGMAYLDRMGFALPELRSGRESFSPDVACYDGPLPAKRMCFVEGPPTFALEVRSEQDQGSAAERALAAKRADDFEADTLIVWVVDIQNESVHTDRADASDRDITFLGGQLADAEPAVPGWRLVVNDIFA